MRVLSETDWRDGYPDYWRAPKELRIAVRAWRNLDRLDDLYFVRRRSLRVVRNYLGEVHPVDLWRKVRSRLEERARNEKFLSCGFGEVLEWPEGAAALPRGELLFFIAPSHPRCVGQVCLPPALTLSPAELGLDRHALPAEPGKVLYLPCPPPEKLPEASRVLGGWSRHSGVPSDSPTILNAVRSLAPLATEAPWGSARVLSATHRSTSERTELTRTPDNGRGGVLFGYGHYAKTTALPNLAPRIAVKTIHEIDPTQIPLRAATRVRWDTSPLPREDEEAPVWLVAGYHGDHAPLAAEGLRRGADVILEKPLAVNEPQLDELLAAMRGGGGRLFACFQRRYGSFNSMAREDLGVAEGDPVSYHCIVYEVPLPPLHWYRWPSSGGRLISNGCHWIDHFFQLNGFADLSRSWVSEAADETITCTLELRNGAVFSMALTDVGSERLGVQDHVELRAGAVTVTITNNTRYRAERSERVLRTKRASRGEAYRSMYTTIAAKIDAGAAGDTLESTERSTRAVLDLERQLRKGRYRGATP